MAIKKGDRLILKMGGSQRTRIVAVSDEQDGMMVVEGDNLVMSSVSVYDLEPDPSPDTK